MIRTLTGENRFLLHAELHRLIDEFVAQYTEMGLERIDGSSIDPEQLRSNLQSLPFLADKRLVIIEGTANNKVLPEKLDQLLDSVPDSTDVIIVEPKFDKRSILYKALKKRTELQEFTELKEPALASWLVKEAKQRGATLGQGDANYLVNRVGPNQLLLAQELDKLLVYDANITRATIDLLTEPMPRSSIFMLLEAAFRGNKKQTLVLYDDQRAQRIDPLAILAMIAWQLHILAVVKAGGSRSSDVIAKEAHISPFVASKAQTITRGMTSSQLKTLVHEALLLDVRLKSEPLDADEALRHYLLSIN